MPNKEDKSNTVRATNADQLETDNAFAARVEDLCRALCRGFGMSEERFRSFEIDAKRHIIAHDHLMGKAQPAADDAAA